MESFQDVGPDGCESHHPPPKAKKIDFQAAITLVLGGKVVVIDIVVAVGVPESMNLDQHKFNISSIKTSYAIPSHVPGTAETSATTNASVSLDAFLSDTVQRFFAEVQLPDEIRDAREAARLGILVSHQLNYLVKLDQIAASNKDVGLQWFVDVDVLASKLESFAKQEAEVVAS